MRLHEYQAKRILARYGVPAPRGEVAASVEEVYQIAARLGRRVVLKAQVLTGGRGRAGGIRLANDAEEAAHLAAQMFGMDVHGYMTCRILVDEAIEVEREMYLGVVVDRRAARPALVASVEGGIERVGGGRMLPEQVYRVLVNPLLGLRAYQVRELAYQLGLGHELAEFEQVAMGLYRAFVECDAILAEANPLVVTPEGNMVNLNAQMTLDDYALFRHRELRDLRDESQETPAERLARRHGIRYVRLGGEVGCVSNGAGLAMATIDVLRLHDIRAANFVDVGIGARERKVVTGLRLALSDPVRAVLVNVFGAVTRCDEIARGLVAAGEELKVKVPLVVRLEGTRCRAGREVLASATTTMPVYIVNSMAEAMLRVAAIVRDGDAE